MCFHVILTGEVCLLFPLKGLAEAIFPVVVFLVVIPTVISRRTNDHIVYFRATHVVSHLL